MSFGRQVLNCTYGLFVLLVFAISVSQAAKQTKGFRGGERGYAVRVEANPIGTNLFYKLPEAIAKSSAPQDWKVDNDNAAMQLAMNLPVSAILLTTNPKFNVQGSWPGYKTDLTLPKDTKTAKKNEMLRITNNESGKTQGLVGVQPKQSYLAEKTNEPTKLENIQQNLNDASGFKEEFDQADIESLPGSEGEMTSSTDIDDNGDVSGSGFAGEVKDVKERGLDDSSILSGSGESELLESTGEKVAELGRRSKVAHLKKSHKSIESKLKHKSSRCVNADKKNHKCATYHDSNTHQVKSSAHHHLKSNKNHKVNDDSNLEQNDHDENDLFLSKVKSAVKKLKKFNLNNPKTNKALKEIITHAKRVVAEAKTVLHDVNNVVRSVQNFVTGNYENVDSDNDDAEVSMTLPDENTSLEKSAEEAREKAERAARKANFAAKKAQAASKMAVEIADNFWKVAKKSRALSKLRDHVSTKNSETISKLTTLHEQDTKEKTSSEKQAVETSTHITEPTKQNNAEIATKFVAQERFGDRNSPQNTEPNKQNNSGFATKVVVQQRFSEHNSSQNTKVNEPVSIKADESPNFLSEAGQDLSAKASSYADRLWSEETLRSADISPEQDKPVAKIAQKSQDNSRQEKLVKEVAKIAQKDALLAKKMSDLVKNKVKDLRKIKSKITENKELKKLTSHVKKMFESPKDVNEVVKNDHRKANAKSKQIKSSEVRKHDYHKVKIELKSHTSGSGDEINDVDNPDQSEPGVSGSYDVELEVEPEQLELTGKPGGEHMKEKKIRIKNTTADGKARKISPVTFAKILKAIRKVEGILGFTIEKEEKENQNRLGKIAQQVKKQKVH